MNIVSAETLNMDLIMGAQQRDETQSNILLSPSFPWALSDIVNNRSHVKAFEVLIAFLKKHLLPFTLVGGVGK